MAIATTGKHNVVAARSTKTLSRVVERICSVGMNPRLAANWSARLVTVSVVKTLPIDLSEVAYIAIEHPSYWILNYRIFN